MSSPHVLVDTAAGTVRGFWREAGTAEASAAFLGIPFAQPPVGDLRFAAPAPALPWSGVRDALAYGATAHRGDPGVTLIPEPTIPGDGTLNVNVFTPAPGDSGAGLPVLVWIHGGGYVAGSPASPWYDGRSFNRDGIVTVTISYRLGFDGFGWIEDAPSNRGVRDWLLALEWVQQNISAFGGDPARVTIAGQSAGGGAVLTLLGMPAAQHLFHGVYALSAALTDIAGARAETLGRDIAARLGLAPPVPTRAALAPVSEERIVKAQEQATEIAGAGGLNRVVTEGLSLGPAIDGDLIPRATLESLAAGVGADKRLVIGATDDEFTMALSRAAGTLRWIPVSLLLGRAGLRGAARRAYLTANRTLTGPSHAAVLGRYLTDRVFRTGVVAAARARGSAPTWVYRYSYRSTQPGPMRGLSGHCIDVPFWFDCLDGPAVEQLTGPNPPQSLADATHAAAVSFVTGGDPGWRSWSDEPGLARIFGGPDAVTKDEPDAYASVAALI